MNKYKSTVTKSSDKKLPMRSVVSVKNRKRIREMEMVNDCFILDFNPYDSLDSSSLSKSVAEDLADDVTIIAEKGHVACRDFPHSRHHCATYPFTTTPHKKHCKLCYCIVCDVSTPCKKWMVHCHATRKRDNLLRNNPRVNARRVENDVPVGTQILRDIQRVCGKSFTMYELRMMLLQK